MSGSLLVDTLRKEFGIPSDAALADELGISQSQISRLRSGKCLSAGLTLAIHEYSGMPVVEIRELAEAKAAPHE